MRELTILFVHLIAPPCHRAETFHPAGLAAIVEIKKRKARIAKALPADFASVR